MLSPAGPVNPAELAAGERFLEQRGYRVQRGRHVLARHGYLAGTDQQRLADLNRAIADPQIRAIFFSRGGYGTTRLLPGLDLDPLAERPRIFLGYSDLTALLNRITSQTGLVTYLGPMVASDMSKGLRGRTLRSFEAMIEGRAGEISISCRPGRAAAGARKGFLRCGAVTAELAGGCLSMIVAAMGTVFQPLLQGKVLFLEEVNEPAYRLDRMLTQLLHGGMLDGLAGLIIGRLRGCGARGAAGGGLRHLLAGLLGSVRCPVYFGFPSGHGPEKVVLPLGMPVTLDSSRGLVSLQAGEKLGLQIQSPDSDS